MSLSTTRRTTAKTTSSCAFWLRGSGRGLLTAEGEDWRLQRRTLAPLFNPRNVATFFPAMVAIGRAARAALAAAARWTGDRRLARHDPGHAGRARAHDLHQRHLAKSGCFRARDHPVFRRARVVSTPSISSACRPGSRGSAACAHVRPSASSRRWSAISSRLARPCWPVASAAPQDLLTLLLQAARTLKRARV